MSVQDNGRSTKRVGGITGKGFRPGQSGNPGGRPKGFGNYIRALSLDGAALVDYVWTVFRDKASDFDQRAWAVTWLADRGFGRPKITTEVVAVTTSRLDLSKLSDEQLTTLEELTKLAAPHVEDSAPGD